MYKLSLLFIVLILFSCKQHKENSVSHMDDPNIEVDTYNPTEEEIKKQRLEDSINILRNTEILEKAKAIRNNGIYTDRATIIDILIDLDFLSGVKANVITLEQIVPDSNSEAHTYLKACEYRSTTTIEFISETSMFDDKALYPIAVTSNLDSDFYYIEKILVTKDGEEIEMTLKRITSEGKLSDDYIKSFMVYNYDFYVLEFYENSFATPASAYPLDIEECEEEER